MLSCKLSFSLWQLYCPTLATNDGKRAAKKVASTSAKKKPYEAKFEFRTLLDTFDAREFLFHLRTQPSPLKIQRRRERRAAGLADPFEDIRLH